MRLEVYQKYSHPDMIMAYVLHLLRVVGIRRTDSQRIRVAGIFTFNLVFTVIPQLIGGLSGTDQSVRASVEFLFNCNIFVGSLLFACEAANFFAFIDELKTLAAFMSSISSKLKRKISRHNRSADKFAKAQTICMGFIGLMYWIAPLSCSYWSFFMHGNSSEPVKLVQHLEAKFYWLDNRSSIRDYTIFAFIMIPVVFACSSICNLKLLTIACSIAHCTFFTELTANLVEQMEDRSSVERFTKNLSTIVLMHVSLLKCIHLLEKTLQWVLLFQWLVCGLNWSISVLYLTSSGINLTSVTVIVMFLLATLETFLYCYLGSRLTSRAEQLERAIYSKRWYEYPVDLQKSVQVMLRQSQIPVSFTVGKFFRVGLAEFSRIVNLSYSAYVVLKDQIKMDTP